MNTETTAYIARLQRELREAHIELIKWRGLALVAVGMLIFTTLWMLMDSIL